MWKQPWGYAEGWTICIGLFITGLILQITTGVVEVDVFHYPANLISGILFILLLLVLHIYKRKTALLRWFSGPEASITSLASLLFLIIVMGLTRQSSPSADLSAEEGFVRLGFTQMTVSWPFILLFLYFLGILGLVVLKRISRFKWKRDTGFILNHAGLFIALFSAVLGSGDLHRLRMTVPLDTPEWRATDEKGEMVELPLAIELKSFTIGEYPPKLLLLDNATGKALPEDRPSTLLVEEYPMTGKLLDWEIEVTDYLSSAASMTTKDTVLFSPYMSEGATSAVYVKASNVHDGTQREGWVSCGNYMFPYQALRLNQNVSLIMPEREPKRFASEVSVFTQEGETKDYTIEVNKPLSVAGWKIYQLSYDEVMGKWSRISVFELVKDPWLPVVYTGIFMMLAGAVYLFVSAPKKSE